ncbi:MAG TPA: serine protein kinase, partial [Gammaproteobacteria bacterium]|nr:serine protein kinase [Gammaproteobacteria bacterium]
MPNSTKATIKDHQIQFIDSLTAFTKEHRARHWEGEFGQFIETVLPADARRVTRSSHEYVWDMFQWYGQRESVREGVNSSGREKEYANKLFVHELFGIDKPLTRVVEYFKAASAGSDV